MACHDVGKVAQALRRVSLRPDVDVDAASSGGVALGACVSELPAKLLQGFDVLNVSRSTAYRIIRKLNDELNKAGKITVAGKVSAKYFYENTYL